jgi:hypothetical protein
VDNNAPNKIKQQSLMSHLDGWAQQQTYWWHTINLLFFGIQNICRWEGKNNKTNDAISHLLFVPSSFKNQPNIKSVMTKNPLPGHSQSGYHFFTIGFKGLCFCYLPNTKFKWNKFKWEILDNSNYDNFHGGGGFSHQYVIMHKYFIKKSKWKIWIHSYYIQLNMFPYMKISYTFCQHLGHRF